MKKLTLITLTLVLMLGSTLHAAKKPNFTPQQIEQVKQMATLFKTKDYGFSYHILSILNYYKIKDPIKMAQTWVANWQGDKTKQAQRLLFAVDFFNSPPNPSDDLDLLFSDYFSSIVYSNDLGKLNLIKAGFGGELKKSTANKSNTVAQRLLFADDFYPKDWDGLFYTSQKSYSDVFNGIKSKLDKYKYKKLKGYDALSAEFNNLINGGGAK